METNYVKMSKTVGDNLVGETYELDAPTAKAWIAGGLCEAVDNPTDTAISALEKRLAERDQNLVTKLSEAITKATTSLKIPAQPKSEDETKSRGEFITLVGKTASNDTRVKQKAYELLENKYHSKAMSEGTGTAGGFLVPVEYSETLLSVEGYPSLAFPNRARIIPVGKASAIKIPVLDQTVTPSGGSSAFAGGVVVTWESENTAPSTTQPSFKQLTLTPSKVMALTQVSTELLENSPVSVEALTMDLFRRAIFADIDYNILNGTGSGQTPFTGIIDNAAAISVKRKTVNTLSFQDIAKMKAASTPGNDDRKVWIVNPAAEANLLQMTDSSGRSVWFVGSNATGNPISTLLGYPVIKHESLPTLGSDGDLCLIDFAYYAIAVNQEVTLSASPHVYFTSDALAYRVTTRLMGAPVITAPILCQDGVTTVSPFVQLSHATS